MKKFFKKQLLIIYIMMIIVSGVMTYVAPKVFAVTSFTASNVTLDPLTGLLELDVTGSVLGSATDYYITDTSGNTYWYASNAVTCQLITGSTYHCATTVFPVRNDSGLTQIQIRSSAQSGSVSQTLDYPLPLPMGYSSMHQSASAGWNQAIETWTYASADAPTYSFTISGDQTGKYSPGMRVRLSQSSTTKYFIITGVSYASGTTTVTIYGGTDYTLANSTISSPYYSMMKAPVGFPLDPNKWTVEVTDNTITTINNPTQGTWYNVDQISIPIGSWNVSYQTAVGGYSTTLIHTLATLSTANSSESDADFTAGGTIYTPPTTSTGEAISVNRTKALTLSSKTTYYLNYEAVTGGATQAGLYASWSKTIIRAVSAYL